MLSKEENELLTRVHPGTPMGRLFRRYWIPALLSEEIPDPDGPPVRVRLLGEDLVAFRDTQGRIGLLDEHCAHRGTSLFFGRNEECGLRCIYHGWKYDIEGNVLETPAEPAGSQLKNKVHHTAYPCVEAGGMVFTFMGAQRRNAGVSNLCLARRAAAANLHRQESFGVQLSSSLGRRLRFRSLELPA